MIGHARLFHSIEKLDIRCRPHPLLGDRQLNPNVTAWQWNVAYPLLSVQRKLTMS